MGYDLQDSDIMQLRRVTKTIYPLSEQKKGLLFQAQANDTFSKAFVREFPEFYQIYAPRKVDLALGNLRGACKYERINTFSGVLRRDYQAWKNTGRIGPNVMAFLLDFLTAFGFTLEGAPPPLPDNEKPRTATELAQMLQR